MKEFNIEAICNADDHYMVDLTDKLNKIIELIDRKKYFTINKARQYGKTTTLLMIEELLKEKYNIISISFEGMSDVLNNDSKMFIHSLIKRIKRVAKFYNFKWFEQLQKEYENINSFDDLSSLFEEMANMTDKPIILMIDEVDKCSENGVFIDLLSVLRELYILRQSKKANTFHSVILAGVHDVKNLKLKFKTNEEKMYNSPWNIAADFLVDMSFNSYEISTMLVQYENDYKTGMDIKIISNEIYNYTGGYPFLVSKICKIIDERLEKDWTITGIKKAVNIMLNEKGTLFDDLIKNISNFKDLYNTVFDIIVLGKRKNFNQYVYEEGLVYGVFKEGINSSLQIHNRIFETLLYNLMIEKQVINENFDSSNQFINEKQDLDLNKILDKFQELMIQEYREYDGKFLEAQGRLIFLAFLKPIINGKGHYFVEAESRNKTRFDIVVTYNRKIYIIELKIWRGKTYRDKGFDQLSEYLKVHNEDKGYMILFNFNKNKSYVKSLEIVNEKKIYYVEV